MTVCIHDVHALDMPEEVNMIFANQWYLTFTSRRCYRLGKVLLRGGHAGYKHQVSGKGVHETGLESELC